MWADPSPSVRSWATRYGIDLGEFESLRVHPGIYSMTVAEAAEQLGIGEEQVRRLLRSGSLAGIPLGGRYGWRISRASIRAHSQLGAARRRSA